MTSLVYSPADVKDSLTDALELATFQCDVLPAATAHYEQAAQENKPMLPWADLVNLYRQVFAAAHKLDLSRFAVPAAPQLASDFESWVNQMEANFGDMADADFASRSGIGMF